MPCRRAAALPSEPVLSPSIARASVADDVGAVYRADTAFRGHIASREAWAEVLAGVHVGNTSDGLRGAGGGSWIMVLRAISAKTPAVS